MGTTRKKWILFTSRFSMRFVCMAAQSCWMRLRKSIMYFRSVRRTTLVPIRRLSWLLTRGKLKLDGECGKCTSFNMEKYEPFSATLCSGMCARRTARILLRYPVDWAHGRMRPLFFVANTYANYVIRNNYEKQIVVFVCVCLCYYYERNKS